MDTYERAKLADAIKEEKFNPGDYIIKEVLLKIDYLIGWIWKRLLYASWGRSNCD